MCGSPATRRSTAGDRARFQCPELGCRLQFLHPQPTSDELTKLYLAEYYQPDAAYDENTYLNTPFEVSQALAEALQVRLGTLAGRRVLDFGAGIGGFALVMQGMGASVFCVEPVTEARRLMTEQGLTCYENLGSLPRDQAAAPFGLVTAIEVVEHLADPVRDLAALRQVIAPGGHLFLATPNFTSLRARLQGPAWEQYRNPTHLFYFTPTSLQRTLREAGFVSISRVRSRVTYPAHGRLRRLLQRGLQRTGLDGDLLMVASG